MQDASYASNVKRPPKPVEKPWNIWTSFTFLNSKATHLWWLGGGFQVMLSTIRKWMSVGSQKSLHEGWMHEHLAVHCLNSKGCWQNTPNKRTLLACAGPKDLWKFPLCLAWNWWARWVGFWGSLLCSLRCEPHLLKGPNWLLLKTFCLSW